MSAASRGPAYGRVLLKLSGEALMGEGPQGIRREVLSRLAEELREVAGIGVQLAVVVGGGNIFRGVAAAAAGMDRVRADYMGMLATVINALALQDELIRLGVDARIQSAISMGEFVEPYARERALRHLQRGRVLIFAAGTGSPFFTTDTAASLRALEIGAEVLLKATRVDGVYSKDPLRHGDARRYDTLTYDQALTQQLGVMDAAAIALCRERRLPIRVFNVTKPGSILRIVRGEREGTLVQSGD